MGLNDTPSGERIHIGFYGLMNAGKSSLINALTGQRLSLVSEIPGTTADPVRKAMEILPLGPVVLIDTAGLDDAGPLGEMRVRRTMETLEEADIAVLVTEANRSLLPAEEAMIARFRQRKIPYLVVRNKADLTEAQEMAADAEETAESGPVADAETVTVSAADGRNIRLLLDRLGAFAQRMEEKRRVLVTDLLKPGDWTLLVIPVDESAPKGRLILPQQQVMRELLDGHFAFAACQPEEIPQVLSGCAIRPALVITDSQRFGQVKDLVPPEIRLTSFSILFARYKGTLKALTEGAETLGRLRDGDRVLISEGCTHHRQCNDIGSVKLPGWIRDYSGANPRFEFSSGRDFPERLEDYRLIVHCGGCMLNEQEMKNRLAAARAAGVPVVNYGIAIAQMKGILKRSLEVF